MVLFPEFTRHKALSMGAGPACLPVVIRYSALAAVSQGQLCGAHSAAVAFCHTAVMRPGAAVICCHTAVMCRSATVVCCSAAVVCCSADVPTKLWPG